MVLIFSGHANESPHIRREVERAVSKGKIIVPFRIENVLPSGAMEYCLSNTHWLDALTPPLEGHLEDLAKVVSAILHSNTADSPARDRTAPTEIPRARQLTVRRRMKPLALVLLGVMLVAALAFVILRPTKLVTPPPPDSSPGAKYLENRNSFIGALPWLNWVLYEPTGYDPYQNVEASDANIRKDLQVLRQHGFDGLITSSSRGTLGHIPRIAHEEGFHMVIVGVWEINDKDEVDNALKAAPYADAYCLGHRGLNKRYPITLLEESTKVFRARTDRPTTTSELVVDYETEPRLLLLSDFLFPDVHTQWQKPETPDEAWNETLELARRAARLAATAEGKPVLLKMVSYPSGGGEGLSPQKQAQFYRLVIEQAADRNDIPARISFSFLSAFDPVWKSEDQGWQKPEQFTGLFTRDRVPKPAMTEVKWRKPR